MLVSIAWRNLWRNRRRTVITLFAIAGGLTGMLTMHAMMSGMFARALEGLTGSYLGHVQVHREGYRERGGATRTVREAETVLAATRGAAGVAGATGRIFGSSHASIVEGEDAAVRAGGGEDVATPVLSLVGLEPESEGRVTDVPSKITKGRWFEGEAEVVVGAGLAERHGIELGHAVLPSAVDMNGAVRGPWAASDAVPRVVGILRSGVASFDDRVAFLPRAYLAKLLGMEDEVHEIAIRAEEPDKLEEVTAAVRAALAAARSESSASAIPASRPLAVAREEAASPPVLDALEVPLVGVEPRAGGRGGGGALAGRYLERAEDVVLSKAVAESLRVGPGDRITVAVPVECGQEVPEEECPPSLEPFVVAGVVEAADVLGGRFALVAGQVLTGNLAALAPAAVGELDEGDRAVVSALVARLRGAAASPDEVLAWTDLAPELAQMMAVLDVMPVIFFVVIFFAVALGIVNTMLMATFERTREIGLMRALGLRPSKVVAMVIWESVLLAAVGVVVGLALALPLVWYWETHGMNVGALMSEEQPIDFNGIRIDPRLWPEVGFRQVLSAVLTIGTMTSLAGIWPALRAARLLPTEALRRE